MVSLVQLNDTKDRLPKPVRALRKRENCDLHPVLVDIIGCYTEQLS